MRQVLSGLMCHESGNGKGQGWVDSTTVSHVKVDDIGAYRQKMFPLPFIWRDLSQKNVPCFQLFIDDSMMISRKTDVKK